MRNKIEIVEGQKFGCRTVIEEVEPRRVKVGTRRRVATRCNCGATDIVDLQYLLCSRSYCFKCPRPGQQIKVGDRFGNRTVIGEPYLPDMRREWYVKVECDCGSINDVSSTTLLRGERKSCNRCANESLWEGDPYIQYRPYTHHPLYGVWKGIKSRIYNTSDPRYEDYGGRGLEMLGEWRDSFGAFAAWVDHNLGERPSELHSIDRIDNDYGYFPTKLDGSYQLKWATQKEQNKNRRAYRKNWGRWNVDGVEGSLFYVCKVLKINDTSVKQYTKPARNREAMTLKEALIHCVQRKTGKEPTVEMLEAPRNL